MLRVWWELAECQTGLCETPRTLATNYTHFLQIIFSESARLSPPFLILNLNNQIHILICYQPLQPQRLMLSLSLFVFPKVGAFSNYKIIKNSPNTMVHMQSSCCLATNIQRQTQTSYLNPYKRSGLFLCSYFIPKHFSAAVMRSDGGFLEPGNGDTFAPDWHYQTL